jgi:prepilin-type N-terminal cleavage/methylation domain-containing protein
MKSQFSVQRSAFSAPASRPFAFGPSGGNSRDKRSTLNAQRRRGFTLIEALVAAVILVVGIAGALAAISAGLRAQGVAAYYQTATWLLQEKLADLESASTLSAGEDNGSFGEPAGYRWRTEVAQGPENSRLWLVTVQVEEPPEAPTPRKSEITTYLLQR